jgi:tRNA-2-methylthio-N6-dimethylallyladenosine synthase
MVIGPQTIHRLPSLYKKSLDSKKTIVDVEFPLIEKFDNLPSTSESKFSEFVTIMEGCSKYCSYCVVPYTRGTEG